MTSGYAPAWLGTNFYAVAPYIVMIAILLVRPYGLLGAAPAERV
jgi:branched-subunit amino acid ABC-type transport system permease component